MEEWSFSRKNGITGEWVNGEDGNPANAVFLTHLSDYNLEVEMTRNMLASYGIATVCKYPGDGDFGSVIMGTHPSGVDIYVPEPLLEDAQNILNSDPIIDNETEQEN